MGGPRLRFSARKRRNAVAKQGLEDVREAKIRAMTPGMENMGFGVSTSLPTEGYARMVRMWVAVKEVPVTMIVVGGGEGGRVVSDPAELRAWRLACARGLEVSYL